MRPKKEGGGWTRPIKPYRMGVSLSDGRFPDRLRMTGEPLPLHLGHMDDYFPLLHLSYHFALALNRVSFAQPCTRRAVLQPMRPLAFPSLPPFLPASVRSKESARRECEQHREMEELQS